MSRGLGRIEQAILRAIEDEKSHTSGIFSGRYPLKLSSRVLLDECYPELARKTWGYIKEPPPPTMAQKKAVNRALRSIVRRYPRYALMGGKGRKPSYLYEPADPRSVMWAKLTVERREFVSLSDVARELNGLEELK